MFKHSLSLVVFKKEFLESIRDKRVILGVIISPLLVTPLLMGTILFFAGKKEIEKRQAIIDIGIVENGSFSELTNWLEERESTKTSHFPTKEEASQAIQDRTIRAAIVVSKDAQTQYQANGSAALEILFNASNENSINGLSRAQRLIRQFDEFALEKRIRAESLPESFASPTEIETTNLATSKSTGSLVLGMILPYLIVISAAFGGIQTAFDLCAGEKERGTMETLLVSPASREELVRGKLLTILLISLIASLCAITGILAPLAFGLELFKDLVGDQISFDLLSILWMLLLVIPLALFTSSLLLVISSFARNQKEAQTYILPFISVVLLPAILSSVLGAESNIYTAFIPVLNISLTMKQIFGNLSEPLYFAISLSTSLLYAYLAMRLATALFQREQILFRT
ncbi:MAG TPA: hypothetical protein DIV79_05815 [Opitutae bacterium]|nr:hypothetical protein [Opitutaceae bacterium]HCR29515.1 hypothetical protein [Opitutae bacterium]|tara:strand:- start:737 stop:1939 length:1203 start_codon:yes stop_codon:yes gene_type:complete